MACIYSVTEQTHPRVSLLLVNLNNSINDLHRNVRDSSSEIISWLAIFPRATHHKDRKLCLPQLFDPHNEDNEIVFLLDIKINVRWGCGSK